LSSRVPTVAPVTPDSGYRDPYEGIGDWTRRLYVCFLQGLFNHFHVDAFRWEPDDHDSKIIITAEAPVDREAIAQKPHIVVMRGGYEWSGLVMDKLRTMNTMTGERTHTDLIPGNLVAHCVAETGMEAGRIADLVSRGTVFHRRLLQKEGGFHHIGQKAAVGPETPPGAIVNGSAEAEAVMVDVTIPWFMQWTWSETPTVPPQRTTLDLVFGEPRASDVEKPPFEVLNDIAFLAHYGLANSPDTDTEFGV